MRETGRGALVGLAVGAVQAVLWAASTPWDGHSGVRGPHSLGMTLAAFLIGSGMAALLRLRRWPLVAFTGAIAALAAVCVLAVSLEEPARHWHLARAFELLGVPLVAPDIAGHGLYAAEAPVVGGANEPVILLEYRRVGAETVGGSRLGIQVIVRRASTATTAEACTTPYYAESWEYENGPPCRAATRDRWVRYGWEGRVAVFTHSGGALVELESHGVEEPALLAAAETIRPTSAETLAKQVHPVR